MTLPGTLQASYCIELGRFVWWGTADPTVDVSAAGLPGGEIDTLTVALPDSHVEQITMQSVPAVLVDTAAALDALAAWTPSFEASASLRVWASIADASSKDQDVDLRIKAMPTAGHAVIAFDTDMIWSAEACVSAALSQGRRRSSILRAELRPYQRAGVAWLNASTHHGGGILADEMGLGKTVQAIALFTIRSAAVHLVVCPTSLLSNWARELSVFAPDLGVVVHRGPDRERRLQDVQPGDVVITSYQTLRIDEAILTGIRWDTIILDEAQQIKNADAEQSRVARKLTGTLRIAMTGTPIENKLDDLWSLMAFSTPHILGNRARFRRRFSSAIEQQHSTAAAERLREMVGPHILRRRKVDVAPELPSKVESTVICALTGEQERLYRDSLERSIDAGFGSGIGRRGRILALLTRLKQICNHPELVVATQNPLAGRSGKLDRITEILTETTDSGEAALVFTQYRRTGDMLANHLSEQITGTTVPFLHGGLPIGARQRMVDDFQNREGGSPIFVLSLRAAGFGLNLTRATHVVHYDRWWNPAVEAQASDRAHRIGQTGTVTVHTLLTERTLEQSIDNMHARKKNLADIATAVAGPAVESNIAGLSDEHLYALLSLESAS